MFILRDCGTGSGGFKAGNACAKGGEGGEGGGAGDGKPKGKSKPDYDKLEKELQVPASLLKEGILDVKGLQESIINVDNQIISDDAEMSEVDVEISDGEVEEIVYSYTVDGAQGEPINLDVNISIQKDYDSQEGYKTDEDGNVIATAAISFTLNADYTESGDPNLVGQGAKILTLVENSITHFMKTCPNQTDFNFSGVGQGRNGLARQLLYRRLAQRVAAKTGGKFVERSEVYTTKGKEYTSSNWYISRTPSRLPRPSEAHSIRAIDENAVYHFTYTYEPALVDPVSDKAAQKFWELDENEDRDCGTGAGGFKAGNACAKGGDGGGVSSSDITDAKVESFAAERDGGATLDSELGVLVPNNPAEIAKLHDKARKDLFDKIGEIKSDENFNEHNSATSAKQLSADAQEVAPAFQEMMTKAAEGKGETNYGDKACCMLKTEESMADKIGRYQKNYNMTQDQAAAVIPDAIRGTIILDNAQGVGDAARSLAESVRAGGGSIKFENKFNAESDSGYIGVHAIIKLPTASGGTINSEVQLHLRAVHDGKATSIKERAHSLYGKTRGTGLSPKTQAAAMSAMQLLFTAAAVAASGI